MTPLPPHVLQKIEREGMDFAETHPTLETNVLSARRDGATVWASRAMALREALDKISQIGLRCPEASDLANTAIWAFDEEIKK